MAKKTKNTATTYTRPPVPEDADLSHVAEDLRALVVPVADLVEDPKNARKHGPQNLAVVGDSLREFTQRKPIVVNARGAVVEAGNGTLAMAKQLGWTHIAAVLVTDDKKTATAFALADNRSAELAEWDPAALLEGLGELGEEWDTTALGFDEAMIDEMTALAKSDAGSTLGSGPHAAPPAEARGDAQEEPDDEDGPEESDTSEGAALMRLLRPVGLRAPFPWFGGKRRVAGIVWAALGKVRLYVEPFAGSLATLLCRPSTCWPEAQPNEHVNDLDGFVANFWRATIADPEAVARACDWPVNETDLKARHTWLVTEGAKRLAAMETDPAAYDAQIAGWWAWGLSSWIGGGWCANAVYDKLPHLGGDRGVTSQLPHLGGDRGVTSQRPHLGGDQGVTSKRPHLGGDQGVTSFVGHSAEVTAALLSRFSALRDRLRDVRVCRGDWSRVLTEGALSVGSEQDAGVGVFLDPPYGAGADRAECYARDDMAGLAAEVRKWALAAVKRDPTIRVVLAGYAGEHQAHMPADWRVVAWASKGAYQRRATLGETRGFANRSQERLWMSPACLALPSVSPGPGAL